VDLSRARRVQRHIGLRWARLDELIVDQILLDFFAADIGQHLTVDFSYAGRKGLATFGLHFPTESGVLDDVFLGVRQIVFREHSPNAGAPTAISFQVSSNFRRIHSAKVTQGR